MSKTSRENGTFPAGTVERILDEFRQDSDAVETLFRVHVDHHSAASLDVDQLEAAISMVNEKVTLALTRGENHTEFLYCRTTGDTNNWYSMTVTARSTVGPIALYKHNVTDRLNDYPLHCVRTDASPFANTDLPSHGLDADEDGVMLDA